MAFAGVLGSWEYQVAFRSVALYGDEVWISVHVACSFILLLPMLLYSLLTIP